MDPPLSPIDSIIVVSFGGPQHPDDVMPFLRNVTRGRNVPEQRLAAVANQYMAVGGKSPINEQNRRLVAALYTELAEYGYDLPVYWGNRNWAPYLIDTVKEMALDGRKNALAFVTSAYSSYSGCRQYREDIETALAALPTLATPGSASLRITKLRPFFNHPGFVEPMIRNTRAALASLPSVNAEDVAIVFTAHSIPISMAAACRYESQLRSTSELIATGLGSTHRWDLAFQSRSGSPEVAWLEPDVTDHLDLLAKEGIAHVVFVPVGFVSDHMEIIYDLDVIATEHAQQLGMHVSRAKTVGADPQFIAMIRELIEEQISGTTTRALGSSGAADCLGAKCCLQADS